jgi:hypothetical protein
MNSAEHRRKKILGMALYMSVTAEHKDATLEEIQRKVLMMKDMGFAPSPKLLAMAEEVLVKRGMLEPK